MASQAIEFIESLIRAEPRSQSQREQVGLAPMLALLERIDVSPEALTCAHIAGSKGKGSTALLLESILRATGRRVATFTSPHLVDWSERFRVDGRAIDGSTLEQAMDHVRPAVVAQQREDETLAPSFFDVLVACGLWIFRQAGAELTILETGLGGRLDATNVVKPAVTCITTIELEHTDRLGSDLAAIAREKAGIIKPAVPVVIGRVPSAASRVIEARARALAAPMQRLGTEIEMVRTERSDGKSEVHITTPGGSVHTRLDHPGAFMADNAALAVGCATVLAQSSQPIEGSTIAHALADTRIPGRFEVVSRAPLIVIDGAHTRDSIQALVETLAGFRFNALHLVLSVAHDKQPVTTLATLLTGAASVITTAVVPSRSMPADALATALRSHLPPSSTLQIESDPTRAIRSARGRLGENDALCITGSMYLAGTARQTFGLG